MATVTLYHYNYRPRLRLHYTLEMEVPIIGDKIHIPKQWFAELGKEGKDELFGIHFIVKEREMYFHEDESGDWRITLERCDGKI